MNIKKKILWWNGLGSGSSAKSLAMTAANQSPYTQTNPSVLNYYNGVSDQNFGASFNIYPTFGALQVITEQGKIDRSIVNFQIRLNADGVLFFLVGDSAGNFAIEVSNSPINPGVWNNIYIARTPGGGGVLYNNGVVLPSTFIPVGAYTHMTIMDSSYRQQIGAATDGQFPLIASRLDNLVLYNALLTAPELAELNLIPDGNPAGASFASKIKVNWPFNNNGNDLGPNGYPLSSSTPSVYGNPYPL